ncbi:MAG: glycosyltransferase [Candidatus Pacearchaeota archaeon]|jgi:glycosyltransferase involved in cell wall biosynthesis
MEPEVSIIIITKQEEKCLPRLLASIKNQTFKNYEVIVSDAQSTDRTREIAESYGCKIVEGGLPSTGRNNGARVAKGNILIFFDADVSIPKDFLKENIKEFKRRNLACATAIYVPISHRIDDKVIMFLYNFWARIMEPFIPYAGGVCIISSKDVFKKTGGFNEKLIIVEDNAFVRSCTKFGKFKILKGAPLFYDVRRLEKEGRLRLVLKYSYHGVYRILFDDPSKAPFNYVYHGDVEVKRGKSFDDQDFQRVINKI